MILLADTVDMISIIIIFVVCPILAFIYLVLDLFDEEISRFIHNLRIFYPEKNLKFITLIAAIVKCDGVASPDVINFVKNYVFWSPHFANCRKRSIRVFDNEIEDINVRFMGYEKTNVPSFMLDRKSNKEKSVSVRVSDLSVNLFTTYLAKYSDRKKFMDILFHVAYFQDGVSDKKLNLLREIAHNLCIKSGDFTELMHKYENLKNKQKKQGEERNRTEKDKGSEAGRNTRQEEVDIPFESIINGFIYNPRIRIPEKNLKTITLFAAVVKCDGVASPNEIEFVKKHVFQSPQFAKYREMSFRFFDSELEDVKVRFLGYKTTNVPFFMLDRKNIVGKSISERVSDISSNLFSKYLKKYVERMDFMDVLFQIAYSQDGVSDVEVDLLREIAHYLCIKSWDLTGFLYKYEYMMDEQQKKRKDEERNRTEKDKGSEEGRDDRQKAHETRFKNVTNTRTKEALQLLEITEKADEQEIKSAYRRLAKKYHPDTLPANASEEEKEEAAARFRSIHEAYEFLLSMEMARVK